MDKEIGLVLDFSTDSWKRLTAQTSWQKDVLDFVQEWNDSEAYVLGRSSGSTGKPKEIKLYKKSMQASAERTLRFFDLTKGDTALLALPIAFVGGKMQVVRAILGQLKLICMEPSNRIELTQNIQFAALTPMQFLGSPVAWSFLEKVILGGAPLVKKPENLPSQLLLYETYGMTETYSHIALRQIFPEEKKIFTPLEKVNIHEDERGCLCISDSATGISQLQTNDLIAVQKDGFRVLGRWDNVINSGGVKVSPEQVESQLIGKALEEKVLISWIPDKKWGQKVVLLSETEWSEADFLAAIAAIQPKTHRPKTCYTLSQFVYTENGKIQRKLTQNKLLEQLGLLP